MIAEMNHSSNLTVPSLCPKPSNTATILHAMAYSILMLGAFLGNILVIFVIYRNKKMRTTVNWFIVNMSISDLIIPIAIIPQKLFSITTSNAWPIHGSLGEFFCKFYYYITDITPAVSVLSLVFMTIDRFYAVMFPMKAALISKSYRIVLLILTWLISIAFFSPYVPSLKLIPMGTDQYQCGFTWKMKTHIIFSATACIVFVVIPFIILIVLYSLILVRLRGRKGTGEELEQQRKRREKTNIAVIKLALAVILAFAICWGPYNSLVFMYSFVWGFKAPADITCTLNIVRSTVFFIAYSNSAINPMIYFILNKNYRDGLKRSIARQHTIPRTTNVYMTEESRSLCMESFHHRVKNN